MALISCPECDHPVSDLATACPSCGYPVAAGIRYAVEQVTEDDTAKSARQQHAAAKLKNWSERYQPQGEVDPFKGEGSTFLDRHWKPILFVFVTIILILQLTWVLSLYR